jgi:23S rRNA pseudouridine2605 synthase
MPPGPRAGRPDRPAAPPRTAPRPEAPDPRGERLQKVLARAGYGSRRACEELITAGRVQVNGEVVRTLGVRVHPGRDRVQVDGEIARTESSVVIMLNKPAGYITSCADPEGRPVVMDLLPREQLPRLFPVGRLDWETEGLLLLTNDGELANFLTHPRHGVRKVYQTKLKGRPTPEALRRLRQGVMCDGERLVASLVEVLHPTQENTWLTIGIEQGRNRQVRRMCEAIGHPVLKLTRIELGPLCLGTLARGEWRRLTQDELAHLTAMRPRRAPERP